MFITRKQYEMDLRRAKAEGRKEAFKEVHTDDRMNNMEHNFYSAIERLERRMDKNIEKVLLEMRAGELKCSCECECECTESEKSNV